VIKAQSDRKRGKPVASAGHLHRTRRGGVGTILFHISYSHTTLSSWKSAIAAQTIWMQLGKGLDLLVAHRRNLTALSILAVFWIFVLHSNQPRTRPAPFVPTKVENYLQLDGLRSSTPMFPHPRRSTSEKWVRRKGSRFSERTVDSSRWRLMNPARHWRGFHSRKYSFKHATYAVVLRRYLWNRGAIVSGYPAAE